MDAKKIGEAVYENGLFSGVCGIVYKEGVSDKIRRIQDTYLEYAKVIFLEAYEKGEVILHPGNWYYGAIFGAYAGWYVDDDTHARLNALIRPYRKEVKDVIMRNVESCYTYNWTMSNYEKGMNPTSPVYIHYTNPFDPEGEGSWKPAAKQRLRYIEPSARIQDRGVKYLYFGKTLPEMIREMEVHINKYEEFYICSFDEAKQIVQELYESKIKAAKAG